MTFLVRGFGRSSLVRHLNTFIQTPVQREGPAGFLLDDRSYLTHLIIIIVIILTSGNRSIAYTQSQTDG